MTPPLHSITEFPLRSQRAYVVLRAELPVARHYLRCVAAELRRLTGCTGVVCREDRYGDTLWDVRVMTTPPIAAALYGLIVAGYKEITVANVEWRLQMPVRTAIDSP